ncbi:MAG: hypothetical protein HW420_1268 [Candidatus Nitrosotenuis sp.]|nr:hypothetical protein [Candidatus Nitrosotenuis sp.]
MQDSTISSWGAQDRFQAHFIVKVNVTNPSKYVARTILETEGHFATKKVTSVSWDGGILAYELNKDAQLNDLIAKQSVKDATIFVDPSDNGVRIYGKWEDSYDFKITKEMYAIYDKIAEYIKKI